MPSFQQLETPADQVRALRARAKRLADAGFSPREVMLENMMFWVQRAKFFEKEAERRWIYAESFSLETCDRIEDKNERAKYEREMVRAQGFMTDAIDALMHARDKSQACAQQAAPYCHPRLSSMVMSGDPNNPIQVEHRTIDPSVKPEEAARSYLKLVSG